MDDGQHVQAPTLPADSWAEILRRIPGTDRRFAALSGNVVHDACRSLQTNHLDPTSLTSKVMTVAESVEFHTMSPDGSLLAVFFRRYPMIRVYECKTGTQLLILRMGMMPGVLDMAFSPDNSIFAIYGDRAYLIHRLTKSKTNEGEWHVDRIRTIERKYTVNVGIMAKEVGISFSRDNKHVVFQEVSVDLRRGKAKGLKVRYEDVDISFRRDYFDPDQGLTTKIIRWNENNSDKSIVYDARRFRLVKFCFSASPSRTYIPPGCVSEMFGVILSAEKSLSRRIPVECQQTGKLVEAQPSGCGKYLLELREQQSSKHLIRKIDMNNLRDINVSELPVLRPPKTLTVVSFVVSDNIAVVIFSNGPCRGICATGFPENSYLAFRPHGWAVYDARHSGSFYTVFKQTTGFEYRAARENLTLSYDGQLLGLVPISQQSDSDCELHVFDVASGVISQMRRVPTCCISRNAEYAHSAKTQCGCRTVIGGLGSSASISSFSRTFRKMSFACTFHNNIIEK